MLPEISKALSKIYNGNKRIMQIGMLPYDKGTLSGVTVHGSGKFKPDNRKRVYITVDPKRRVEDPVRTEGLPLSKVFTLNEDGRGLTLNRKGINEESAIMEYDDTGKQPKDKYNDVNYVILPGEDLRKLGRMYPNGIKYNKNGGSMTRKYQQGGQLSTTQQEGLQYLAQMYVQQTGKDPQQDQEGFMQFVQQLAQQAGVQDIGQLLDMVYQQAQGQAQSAKRGAKLNYLKRLSGNCPEGEQLVYFKAGGRVCSKCMAKVKKDKCGSKMKKKKGCGGFKVTNKFQLGGGLNGIHFNQLGGMFISK